METIDRAYKREHRKAEYSRMLEFQNFRVLEDIDEIRACREEVMCLGLSWMKASELSSNVMRVSLTQCCFFIFSTVFRVGGLVFVNKLYLGRWILYPGCRLCRRQKQTPMTEMISIPVDVI